MEQHRYSIILYSIIFCWKCFFASAMDTETCSVPAESGALFSKPNVITNRDSAHSIVSGDFNGDGFLDIAATGGSDYLISWYKNIDGTGSFSKPLRVWTNLYVVSTGRSIATGDFNGDGFLDIVFGFSLNVMVFKDFR